MKRFYIFLVLNFKAIFHLIGYIFMVLGACLVNWRTIFDPGMLFILLILNFFVCNYQWRRSNMGKTTSQLYKLLTMKDENKDNDDDSTSEN
jgi:hypothetical protein